MLRCSNCRRRDEIVESSSVCRRMSSKVEIELFAGLGEKGVKRGLRWEDRHRHTGRCEREVGERKGGWRTKAGRREGEKERSSKERPKDPKWKEASAEKKPKDKSVKKEVETMQGRETATSTREEDKKRLRGKKNKRTKGNTGDRESKNDDVRFGKEERSQK